MKTRLLLFIILLYCSISFAQATFFNGFESVATPSGWDYGGFTRITSQFCTGTASLNLAIGQFAASTITSPNYVSDGSTIIVSTMYKMNYQGIIYLQYTIDNLNWIDIVVTSTTSSTCNSLSGTITNNTVPAGTNIKFRILIYNASTPFNVTFTFDDFQALQTSFVAKEYTFNSTLSNILGTEPFSGSNTSYTSDRNSVANNALNITTSTAGTSATINTIPIGNQPRSISFWYKVSSNVANSAIFSYGTAATNRTFGMYIQATGRPVFQSFGTDQIFGTGSYVANTWHHVVITYDVTNVRIYMNGTLTDTKPFILNTGLSNIKFGNNSTNVNLDDLKIYDYAILQADVTSLFNNNTLSASNFQSNNLKFNLYPNPATDILNISLETELKSVEIYSLLGQKVLTTDKNQVYVSELSKGIYMVRVEDVNNGVSTQKLVVE